MYDTYAYKSYPAANLLPLVGNLARSLSRATCSGLVVMRRSSSCSSWTVAALFCGPRARGVLLWEVVLGCAEPFALVCIGCAK